MLNEDIFFSIEKDICKLSIFHLDKSGKDDKEEQPLNKLLHSFKLIFAKKNYF